VKAAIIVLAVCASATPSLAQEPVGCDKFKWPLDKERATLTGTDLPKLQSGDKATFPIPFGATLALAPFSDAKLPTAPERTPKDPNSFAGYISVPAPVRASIYKITLSAEGWVDVVQNGAEVKSGAFSGALGCEGIRKSVKFDLAQAPFTLELSSVKGNAINLTVSGD
jgi:hypothetical protein